MFQSARWTAVVSVMALLAGAGCANQNSGSQNQTPLYERLGGQEGIQKIVYDFVPIAVADAKLNFFRKGTPGEYNPTPENVDKLEKSLVDYFCAVAGGPQKYQGKDMKTAHSGMQISDAEFEQFKLDLHLAMDKNNVSDENQEDLLGLVQSTHKDVVEAKKM